MMNERLKNFKNLIGSKKSMYILLCVGVIGMLLIAFTPSKDEQTKVKEQQPLTNEQYCEQLEQKLKKIVTAITGDKRPSVTVTLDTGVKYIYADETKTDSEDTQDVTSNTTKTQTSDKTENYHVIIEDSSGSQQALLVTEYMPTVRGVTVICMGGEYEDVAARIKDAVMTALDITSKRVFVTGK